MSELSLKGNKPSATKSSFTSFLFVLPAIIIFCVFYIYPFYDIFRLSLLEWNGIDVINFKESFVGFQNFVDLWQDTYWKDSLWHAGFITVFALTLQNLLAFVLALACDRELRMKNFYKVVFFIPPVLSEVVVGWIWVWILNSGVQQGEQIGFLNHILVESGLPQLVNNWLSNPKTALPCIAIIHSWKGFGWGFIMFLAGLQTIDKQLYEAARVDGANNFSVLKNVTIPMMIPVFLVVVILTILGSMQSFVLVITMTPGELAGHTSVPVTRILDSMYSNTYGYACAQGVSFGIILISVSLIFKLISDRFK